MVEIFILMSGSTFLSCLKVFLILPINNRVTVHHA
nr:MAG TPA: hypothetical protein [Caudoviricetes sp.]